MLYGPNGSVMEARHQEHWPPEFMKFLALFAETCTEHGLTLVCRRCKSAGEYDGMELSGANAREDNYWKMECSCRTYIGRNPMNARERRGHA